MTPFKGDRGLTPAPTEREKDLSLALRLLCGDGLIQNGRLVHRYLSSSTKPTEKEGRQALARSLLAIAADVEHTEEAAVLVQVARLFDPAAQADPHLASPFGTPPPMSALYRMSDALRTVDFKMVSKGQAKSLEHFQIAHEVERLRRAPNMGKQKAVRAVAEKYGMTDRRVYEICRKVKLMADR